MLEQDCIEQSGEQSVSGKKNKNWWQKKEKSTRSIENIFGRV